MGVCRDRSPWGAASFAVFMLMLPSAVDAQFAGCQCGFIRTLHGDTRDHVSDETTQAAQNIIEAMRAQTRQTSQYLDRQVEAAERIADATAQNQAHLVRSRVRADAESGKFDPNPDFCLVLDTALAADLPQNTDIPSAAAALHGAASWTRGDDETVRTNGLQMAAYLARERTEIINAGGSQDATTDWTLPLSQNTLELDDPLARRSLPRLIANTVDPFPPKPLSDEDLRTPAGLSEAVRRRAAEARNQAALSAIGMSLELASPSLPAGPYRTIAQGTRYSDDIPDVISELQALEIRTAAYYAPDAETLERRHSKNERALLQDLIDLIALNTRIAHLRLQQERHDAVVQAALLGLLTDGTVSNMSPP